MAKKGQIYFCEICRQKIEVAQEGFGVLVCCGEDMKPVGEKGMMATWTSVHPKPVGGAVYTCNKCGQKINVVNETTGILECCGERMHHEEASVG